MTSTITVQSGELAASLRSADLIDLEAYCATYGGPTGDHVTYKDQLEFVVRHLAQHIDAVVTHYRVRQAAEAAKEAVLEERQSRTWEKERPRDLDGRE